MGINIEFGTSTLYSLDEAERLKEEEIVEGLYYDARFALRAITRRCSAARAVARIEEVNSIRAGFYTVSFEVFDRLPKTPNRKPLFRTKGRFYDGIWDDALKQQAMLGGIPIESAYLLEEAIEEVAPSDELTEAKPAPRTIAQIGPPATPKTLSPTPTHRRR